MCSACIAALGGLAQINPIWLYGPFNARGGQHRRATRLVHGLAGRRARACSRRGASTSSATPSPSCSGPASCCPALTFGLLYLWPFLEARVTRDRAEHHLLDRPRDRPVRTAIGVGVLTFYVVLFVAGSQDIVAQKTSTGIPSVLWTFRILVLVVPAIVATLTWRICHDLTGADEIQRTKEQIRSHDAQPQPEPGPLPTQQPEHVRQGRVLVVAPRRGRPGGYRRHGQAGQPARCRVIRPRRQSSQEEPSRRSERAGRP